MIALWRLLIDLCLSRRGPDSLPDSPVLLALFAGLDLSLSFVAALSGQPPVMAALESLVSLMLLSILIGGLLLLLGFPDRIRRTLIAAFGIDAGVTLIALPLIGLSSEAVFPGSSLLLLAVVLWGTFVLGQALGAAISRGRSIGLLAALMINYTSLTLMATLFGG